MATPNVKTPARLSGSVRVVLPARIAFNAESLKRTIASVMEHLGCPRCFSGASCHFQAERDLIVDRDGKLSQVTAEINPQPLPPRGDLIVSLAAGSQFSIDKVNSAVDAVIGTIGSCLACHSGRDVAYLNEVGFIGVDPAGQAQQYGG